VLPTCECIVLDAKMGPKCARWWVGETLEKSESDV
jgi:hypothetical protein